MAANMDEAMAEAVSSLSKGEDPFAIATIVRTVGATAAKPGSKALLSAKGEILQGWLGGGCTRSAVRKAALAAFKDGQPRLISVAPEDALSKDGVAAGQAENGIHYARNGCPSKGTIDIFIEPTLPAPELVIIGGSPVAKALEDLAKPFHWDITTAAPDAALAAPKKMRAIVVATQGQGDRVALETAIASGAEYVGFVGSRRKFAALSEKMNGSGVNPESLARIRAPAGLAIGAVTPDEIALSILAELTEERRKGARRDG
ncbi:MAG: XdhC family protein [Pseudomonadota bacterium]